MCTFPRARVSATAGVIAERLRAMGLEVETGIALTGVTALLRGAQPGRTIALRADMDALPVTEAVDFWVGITPPQKDPATAAFNHSPLFFVDEAGLAAGTRALLAVAVDYLEQPPDAAKR